MQLKRFLLRMSLAAVLGLCIGIAMEYSSLWSVFPVFMFIGIFLALFVEIVIEILRFGRVILQQDLTKIKKSVLIISVPASIGLLLGLIIDAAAVWAAFPLFLALGTVLGLAAGLTIELIRYTRAAAREFLEGRQFGLHRLPADSAELIRQIIKKMRYRKEARSHVMAELTAHFEDELKDCTTEEDKQQKAQQLIADFGDPKLLAVLLRRAKKRCRPLWRTVVVRTFQTAGVLLLCFIIYAVWFSMGTPAIKVDYLALLNQLNKPQVREEDNAWPHYEKAIALYVQPDDRIRTLVERPRKDFNKRLPFDNLDKEKQDMIMQWLKENQSLWENMDPAHRRLLERCFNHGLVPLIYPDYLRYSAGRYKVLDEAVEDIISRIELLHRGPETRRFSEYSEYEMMMRMQWTYDYDRLRRKRREIEMDTDITLDSEIISLFISYSKKELESAKRAIEVGLIKYWIDNPPPDRNNLFDCLFPFEKKLIARWIKDNHDAWREFAQGSAKPYCYREFQTPQRRKVRFLWSISYAHLNQIKQFSRLGIWRSRADIDKGQIKQSTDNCLAIARAGTHWQEGGTMVEQLVGFSITRVANTELFHIIAHHKFPADRLTQLQYHLVQLYPQGYPLLDIEGEKIAFMDAVQRLFTDGGPGGGHLIPRKDDWLTDMYDIKDITEDIPVGANVFRSAALTSVCLLHARRDATVEAAQRIYDRQAEILRMTPYQRRESNLISADKLISSMPRFRYTLLDYFIPAADRISDLVHRARASHQALITVLAIQRWRLDKNQYPAGLQELIDAGYLKDLPMDPYSDKSLIYKRTRDNFTLYSVGENFKDDGGKVFRVQGGTQKWGTDKDGDAVFWPLLKP
jgi:hypothetical protein